MKTQKAIDASTGRCKCGRSFGHHGECKLPPGLNYKEIPFSKEFNEAWGDRPETFIDRDGTCHFVKNLAWFFWIWAVDRCSQNAIDEYTEGLSS